MYMSVAGGLQNMIDFPRHVAAFEEGEGEREREREREKMRERERK